MTTTARKADILVRIARFGNAEVEYTFIENTRRGKKALAYITGEKGISSEAVRGQMKIKSVLGSLLRQGCFIALVEDQEQF